MKKTSVIILVLISIIIAGGLYFLINYLNSSSEFEIAKQDVQNENFSWFSNLVYFSTDISESRINEIINGLKESYTSGNYSERQFYDVFGELAFASTTPEVGCIQKKESPRCIFFNAVLTNNEELCNLFPEKKEESVIVSGYNYPGIMYYKHSCILSARIHKIYLDAENKTEFCGSFNEDYIKEACDFYTLTPQRDFSMLY